MKKLILSFSIFLCTGISAFSQSILITSDLKCHKYSPGDIAQLTYSVTGTPTGNIELKYTTDGSNYTLVDYLSPTSTVMGFQFPTKESKNFRIRLSATFSGTNYSSEEGPMILSSTTGTSALTVQGTPVQFKTSPGVQATVQAFTVSGSYLYGTSIGVSSSYKTGASDPYLFKSSTNPDNFNKGFTFNPDANGDLGPSVFYVTFVSPETETYNGYIQVSSEGCLTQVISLTGTTITTTSAPITTTPITFSGVKTRGKTTSASPEITWPTLTGANTYCIKVSKDSLFTNGVTSVCGLSSPLYTFNSTASGARLEAGSQVYFFQVAGVDVNGNQSPWSETQSLEIAAAITSIDKVTSTSFGMVPNPASGSVVITSAGSIVIVDLFGSVIYSGNAGTINVSGFAKGIYVVKTIGDTAKLVVE